MYKVELIPIGFSYKKLLVETTSELMEIVKKHMAGMLNSREFDTTKHYTSPLTKNHEYVKVSITDKMTSLITMGEPIIATIEIKPYSIAADKSMTKEEINGIYIKLVGFKKK